MPPSEIHEFDGFLLDVGERRLSRHAETIALAPKAHDLLVALVRRAGRLVTKQDLLELVPAVRERLVRIGVQGTPAGQRNAGTAVPPGSS